MLHCRASSDLQSSLLIQLQRTGGERTNWTLLRIAHPFKLTVSAEMINQTDEVRSVSAHACVCFCASGHTASTEPWEITEVKHHSFALIQPNILSGTQVALLNAPMNSESVRPHLTYAIYKSKSKLNRPSPECCTEGLVKEHTLFHHASSEWIYAGVMPHHWKSHSL